MVPPFSVFWPSMRQNLCLTHTESVFMPIFTNGRQMDRSHCSHSLVTGVWWNGVYVNIFSPLMARGGFSFIYTIEIMLNTIFNLSTQAFLNFILLPFYLCIYSRKVDAKFCKTCSFPCWDLLCQQSSCSVCFSNKPWKWELIMEILADLYRMGC